MISVIVPALNEERVMENCIHRIREGAFTAEIIVADGGSSDRTRDIAAGFPDVGLVVSEKGRGIQMNAGAAAATGDVLLFLHADTWLAPGWSDALNSALSGDSSVAGGAFSFRIDHPARRYRLVEAMVSLRCRLFKLPYGDQAIFIRREAFEKIGGYPAIPIMEDVELVSQMKTFGRICILDHPAYTDARRWEQKGVLKTSLSNLFTLWMYKLGADPGILARWYYK